MRRLLLIVAVGLATTACLSDTPEEFHTFGSREGDLLQLDANAPEQQFRARLCRQTPEDVEVDVRLAANVHHPGSAELTVTMTTSEEDRTEAFAIDGPTRVEVDGFDPVDPDASCEDGIPIVFRATGMLTEPVEIEWGLHYGFRATSEISGTEVDLEREP